MSKISYPQLVKNLADAYRAAIGNTDPIVIGELTAKVTEAMSTGGGKDVKFKSITYNEDNSITIVDNDNKTYTVSCVYENGKIVSIALDDEEVILSYDGDELVGINDSKVDFEHALTNNRFFYKSITYNEDNSITLIDHNDVVHTLYCVYEDGKLVSASFDGQETVFDYNGESLIDIEGAELNFENAPSSTNGDNIVAYKAITYKLDDTIVFLDDKNVEHIMTCDYEDLKLTSVTYDGEVVPVTYVGNSLASVDGTSVDVEIKEEEISFDNFYSNSIYTKEDLTGTKFYRENVSTGENFTKGNLGYVDLFVPANTQYKVSFTLAGYQCVSDDDIYIGIDPSKPASGYAPSNRLVTVGLNRNPEFPTDYSYTLPLSDTDKTYYFCVYLWSKYYRRDTYVILDNFNFTTIEDTGTGDTINKRIIKNKEYQDGLIVGLASKGKVKEKSMYFEKSVVEVRQPVYTEPIQTDITNNTIEFKTEISIESEE